MTEALDVVVLQEVGGLREIKCKESSGLGSLRELSFPEESELVDYRVFGTWEGDSHLSQMILLDESVVDSVIATHAGRRCVEVICLQILITRQRSVSG